MTLGQTEETLYKHGRKEHFRLKNYSRLKKWRKLTKPLHSNTFLTFFPSYMSAVYSTYLTRHFDSLFEKYFSQKVFRKIFCAEFTF